MRVVLSRVQRKKLLLNPQPRYKLLSGDTAFMICSKQSHADRILNLTPDAVRQCMEGTHAHTTRHDTQHATRDTTHDT
jgi:hypothetical protein